MKNIRLLVVENRTLVRAAFRKALSHQKNIALFKEADHEEAAIKFMGHEKSAIVLIDIKTPNIRGLETVRLIKDVFPDSRMMIITPVSDDFAYIEKLVQSGITGFLAKDSSPEELMSAIEYVHAGKYYISAKITKMLSDFNQKKRLAHERSLKYFSLSVLSPRETEVFFLIVKGFNIQEMAKKFDLSTKTINTFRTRIYKKLKAENDVELIHIAVKNDLINVHEIEYCIAPQA